jgi:hypothetical protein
VEPKRYCSIKRPFLDHIKGTFRWRVTRVVIRQEDW